MLASIIRGLHQRFMSPSGNYHTNILIHLHCWKPQDQHQKPLNGCFSIVIDEVKLQMYWSAHSHQPKVVSWLCPHPEKHCIVSSLLMISKPCSPSVMNHTNCLYVALRRHPCNWCCVVPNVFYIVVRTEILIIISIVCKGVKSHKTISNVILLLSFWHCTPLSLVIKGLEVWARVIHHSLDRHFD
jgi:hypothetical protein